MIDKSEDLCYLSATELAKLIKQKELSPVEVIDTFLSRIDSLDSKINAFCTVVGDEARKEAIKAENAIIREEEVGPLHGVPVAVKDLLPTEGLRTTFGSKLFENFVPTKDAVSVYRLKQAGAILLGKTNTPEFGHKATTDNLLFGVTKNPWNLDLTTGGSSGGSAAAVSIGFVPFAVGTDSGGSIRIPASACGVYGFKPTYGRIPFDLSPDNMFSSQNPFSHVGPISRTVNDAALLLSVMAGPDPIDPYCLPKTGENFLEELKGDIKGLRIGYFPNIGRYEVDTRVQAGMERAIKNLDNLGCQVDLIDLDLEESKENLIKTFFILFSARFATSFSSILPNVEHLLSSSVINMIKEGQRISATEYKQVELTRTLIWNKIENIFQSYDLFVTPTLAVPPFSHALNSPAQIHGKPVDSEFDWLLLTPFLNLTGHPAASLPIGFTEDNLPMGMQIVGRRFEESMILRLSHAYEKEFPWTNQKPNL